MPYRRTFLSSAASLLIALLAANHAFAQSNANVAVRLDMNRKDPGVKIYLVEGEITFQGHRIATIQPVNLSAREFDSNTSENLYLELGKLMNVPSYIDASNSRGEAELVIRITPRQSRLLKDQTIELKAEFDLIRGEDLEEHDPPKMTDGLLRPDYARSRNRTFSASIRNYGWISGPICNQSYRCIEIGDPGFGPRMTQRIFTGATVMPGGIYLDPVNIKAKPAS